MDPGDLGRSGRFEDLRGLLGRSGYNDEFIRMRYHLPRAEEFELDRRRRTPLPRPEFAADILTTLFLAGDSVTVEDASRLIGEEGLELLAGMGLLERQLEGRTCFGTVALYPVESIYIASDRWNNADETPFVAQDDLVYPAFVPNTRLFLRHLPKHPCGAFLDLCAGSGAAALLAARRGAAEVWSSDITGRSTRFAEFNRKLNDVENFHAVTGDLYGSLEGRRFDTIAAHPPYVPSLQTKWIFYSAGQDGEEITRRMIYGLREHLNPGGIFLALTMAGDRRDQPLERRLREWMGDWGDQFDIALIVRTELDPEEFAVRANRETVRVPEEAEAWRRLFARLQTTALVYGFVVIRRRSGWGRSFTVRRQAPCGAIRSPWEWLLAWESAAAGDELSRLILDSRLYAAKNIQFQVGHRLENSDWTPAWYKLLADYPFRMEGEVQPWMAHLLALCGNGLTGREALTALRQNQAVSADALEAEFAQAAATLVSGGFLEVEGFRPPPATE